MNRKVNSKLHAAFVMEQHLGHSTYYQNLRRFVDQSPRIDPTWVNVTYSSPGSFWERLPLLPKSLRGTLVGRSQVRAGLGRGPFDVALFNTQVPAALAGNLVREQPYVVCTDITPIQYDRMGVHYGHRPDQPGILHRYKQRVNTRLLRRAARLLPWSTWTRSSLIDDYGADPAQIEVIPPGVDTEVWRPGGGHARGSLRVLFVGGDLVRKGGDFLLEACALLPEGTLELILVTRSPAPDRKGITTYHHMSPNTPELIGLYQTCDVFVLPTRAEAFGIAAVEASSVGLPVIATGVGGLTDIVIDNETGFLISLVNPRELADRLQILAENPDLRRRFGQAARARVEACFDARKNSARVIEILLDAKDSRNKQFTED
jgi:glycosyltransferase involved in cell wall biosynthesis